MDAQTTVMSTTLNEEQIVARIERLPLSGWYTRVIGTAATAHFFDACDSLTIAFVLPVLIGLWHISSSEIGVLFAAGFVGQLIGAVVLGWLAERYGRIRILQASLIIIAVFSAACAFAWNYISFFWFRTIQGLGLGGEVPVAATYVNEFTPARLRGRLIMALQATFGIGIAVISVIATWLIPTFGWQSMFLLGAVPVLLAIGLRFLVPESPRWLAGHGRLMEADAVVVDLERAASRDGTRPLPQLPAEILPVSSETASFSSLFKGIYLKRTLSAWTIAFCTSFIGYGLILWTPTIVRTVYKLPIEDALRFGVILNGVGLGGTFACLALIDFIGRRASFLIAFLGSVAGMTVLWAIGDGRTAGQVVAWGSFSCFFLGFLLTGIYVYVPETYPTRMRALGTGVASSLMRLASIVGPLLVGFTLDHAGIGTVFLMFGIASLIGAAVVATTMVETRGRILEQVSP
jgi:putative MFS transporter